MNETKKPFPIEEILFQQPCMTYASDCAHQIINCSLNDAIALGFSHPDEVVGKDIRQVIGAEFSEEICSNNELVMTEEKLMVFEETARLSNGRLQVFISEKKPLYDAQGHVCGVIGNAIEVSEVYNHVHALNSRLRTVDSKMTLPIRHKKFVTGKRIQDILLDYFKTVSNYYDGIISCMPGHVFWVDQLGTVLGINHGLADALNSRTEDILGRNLKEIMPAETAEMTIENNKQVMKNRTSQSLHETVTMSDGSVRTYFSTKRPLIGDDDEVVGVLGTAIDITERKKIESEVVEQRQIAERASEAKTEFLLNMSHDLRTPCSGILGYAKIMLDQETDPEKKKMLGCITQSSQHLLNLLNEILDYTRVDASLFEVRPRSENIRELLNSIIELLSAELSRKKLQCRILYDEQLAEHYEFDPVILHRVVLNLLSNAIKFSDSGCIDISASYSSKCQNLLITVRDKGIGIADIDKERIFEKFTKVSNSYSGIHQGTGLGLATVVRLLDRVNGSIELESQLDQGSCFTVKIPSIPTDTKHIQQSLEQNSGCLVYKKSQTPLNANRTPPLNVLVVEDDHISKQVTQILLDSLGFTSTILSSGQEALCEDLAQFDLIIMDIGLPDMDGHELIVKIREWEQEHNHRPAVIVAVTAHVDYKKHAAAELGFNAVMQKPLTMEKLETLLAQV